MAAGNLLTELELISPSDFIKQQILSVQRYALLSARAIGNLFQRPLYVADTVQQADFIGWGSLPIISWPEPPAALCWP